MEIMRNIMWEWRVFFQLSKDSQPDIWDLLHCRPWFLFPDRRTDVYIVCSASSGVKLRGKKILEVKLRTARHASGAEHWEKVCSRSYNYTPHPLCTFFLLCTPPVPFTRMVVSWAICNNGCCVWPTRLLDQLHCLLYTFNTHFMHLQ